MDEIAYDSTGLPWLDQPVMLHSSRVPDYGPLTEEQLAYVTQYWLFW
jgi:ferric-chelate reductase